MLWEFVDGAGEAAGAWMKDQTGRMVGCGVEAETEEGGAVELVDRWSIAWSMTT